MRLASTPSSPLRPTRDGVVICPPFPEDRILRKR